MTELLAPTKPRRLRSVGWAALLAFVIGWSYTSVAAGERSDDARPTCPGDGAPLTDGRFEPIIHDISTSARVGSDTAEVRWILSSEVTAAGDSTPEGVRYCYAYLFRNVGTAPVKVSLVSPRLALSPLFEIMQDFSLVLPAGATKLVQFSTVSAPEMALTTLYNSAMDKNATKWNFISSRPVSLYLPASLKPSYVQSADTQQSPEVSPLQR
jgi:hypothetical protein